MKTTYKYTFIILILFAAKVQGQTELNNYLLTAAQNNPGLKAKFATYHASLEVLPQVSSLPNMEVSFGYFVSPIETKLGPQQAKFSVRQMFPWFGTLNSNEDVFEQRAKADYELFEEAKSKLFFDVKSVYFNIYIIKKGITITEENIAILNTFRQLALIKVETGKSSIVDVLRVDMEINELDNKLAYLNDSQWALEVEFHNLINDSLNSQVFIPDSLWNDNLLLTKEILLDSILSNNHLVKQIEHKIYSLENEVVSSRKEGSPQIILGLDYAVIGNSENPELGNENGRDAIMPLIGFSIPLYRNKYKAMTREASIKIEAKQFEKEEKQNELMSLFEKGYRNLNDADRRIQLYRVQLKLADKSLNILLTSYSSDGQNFEELLRMERKVLDYALELDKARADKNAAVAFINYLTGK